MERRVAASCEGIAALLPERTSLFNYASCSPVTGGVIRLAKRAYDYASPGCGCVDELVIPHVHPDMRDTTPASLEENQVSRLQFAPHHGFTARCLSLGTV